MIIDSIKKRVAAYKKDHLYRQYDAIKRKQGADVDYKNKHCVSFCSNDYLGLSRHPEVIKTFQAGAEKYGVGSGASFLISGYCGAHKELEDAFTEFFKRDRAVLFPSGYMANLGVLTALATKKTAIFQDKNNHASLIDAGKLTQNIFYRYAHNNVNHLSLLLNKNSQEQNLIATEGVFSMSGDIAHLDRILSLAKQHQALVVVDDAHGIGVLGKTGRGTLEKFGLSQNDVDILVCPLGKSFGCTGAVVLGRHEVIDALIQFARTFIYTTGISPAMACAAKKSLAIITNEPHHRNNLQQLITYFDETALNLKLKMTPSETAIKSLVIGDSKTTLMLSDQLLQKGYLVQAIRPPTVHRRSTCLRITINSFHTKDEISNLLYQIAKLYEGLEKKI